MTGFLSGLRSAMLRLTGRHRIRLHLGLGIAAALVLAGGLVAGHILAGQLDRALSAVALSGRQEALVQQIARTAPILVRTPAPGTETRLSLAVADFDLAQRQLSAAADMTPRVTRVYFENGALSLTALARSFLDLAQTVLDNPAQARSGILADIARLAETALTAQLREASVAFELHAAETSATLRTIRLVTAAILLLLGAAEGWLVVRPLRSALSRSGRQAHRDEAEIARLAATLATTRGEVERLTESLIDAGWTDELTGLMNRGHFQMRLEAELAKTDAEAHPLTVVAMAADDLRRVNESLGHAAGDTLLRTLADRLRAAAPEGAALARIDGNGFALAARAADADAARALADRLAAALSQPVPLGGRAQGIAVRAGVAVHAPGETAERLLGNADISLGQAGGPGPVRVGCFVPTMRAKMEDRNRLKDDLRAAVEDRTFHALFQPQVGLGGKGLCGFEVLARWQHPVHGLLAPDRFLAVAEDIGLVDTIDGLVLEHALSTLSTLRAEGLAIPGLSVNASARSLLGPGYAGALRDAAAAAGLTPGDLTVEISQARLRDIPEERAQEAINHLRWSGFQVEIDGFGTGLAALSTLSRLPVTGVKLDRALVSALPDGGAENVLRALAGLAADLGLRVVAEGVQSSTSLGFLAGIGVQAVQGFGLSRPLSAEDVRRWMGAGNSTSSVA